MTEVIALEVLSCVPAVPDCAQTLHWLDWVSSGFYLWEVHREGQ